MTKPPRRTISEADPDPIDVHVGRRLRQPRLLANVSQVELGEAIGVSFQAVQKYEHGENRLSASRLFKAAQMLKRPISFFFEELEGAPKLGARGDFSRDEVDLMQSFRQIPDDRLREQVLQFAKSIGQRDDRGAKVEPPPDNDKSASGRRRI